MNILKKLKDIFKPPHKSSAGFYETVQKYIVSFSVEIRNNVSEDRSCRIVFPVPFSDTYQQCTGLLFSPQGNFRARDIMYNNAYAWWRLRFPPKGIVVVQENFEVRVEPRRVLPEPVSSVLGGYDALERNIVERYLQSNRFVSGKDERIKKITRDSIGSEKNIAKIIARLNAYAVSRLSYGNPIEGLYSFSDALEKEKVDCGGFDTFLVSLLIAAGIPARVVSGFFAGYAENSMHAWVEALLPDGTWFPLDPSMEKLSAEGKTKKSGKFGFVGSDRVALSMGCDIPIAIDGAEDRVAILQNPLLFAGGSEKDFSLRVNFSTSRKE